MFIFSFKVYLGFRKSWKSSKFVHFIETFEICQNKKKDSETQSTDLAPCGRIRNSGSGIMIWRVCFVFHFFWVIVIIKIYNRNCFFISYYNVKNIYKTKPTNSQTQNNRSFESAQERRLWRVPRHGFCKAGFQVVNDFFLWVFLSAC